MKRLRLVRRRPGLLPPNEPDPACKVCGHEMDRVVCWQCGGEGVDGHDCGEDCCCCLYPEDNETCDICGGAGAWWACPNVRAHDKIATEEVHP